MIKDLFSAQSKAYAQFRPEYPAELYEYLLQYVPARKRVWDCATGNGQAAKMLCTYFEEVCATDISPQQLQHAFQAPNIQYSLQPAEHTDLPDGSFDLVTVAQALHWFRLPAFFAEVRRVLRPGGVLAVWGYAHLSVVDCEETNKRIQSFYYDVVGPYWDEARYQVENHYADIVFPFEKLPSPSFPMIQKWHLYEMEGYLNSWSATQAYIRANDHNPVDQLMLDLTTVWGERTRKTIEFPLFLHAGHVV